MLTPNNLLCAAAVAERAVRAALLILTTRGFFRPVGEAEEREHPLRVSGRGLSLGRRSHSPCETELLDSAHAHSFCSTCPPQ